MLLLKTDNFKAKTDLEQILGINGAGKTTLLKTIIGELKPTSDLSEGNKRKLSTAIAFLGNPKLIVLDEPTTGMDPSARVYFWNLIKKSQNYGITSIISSHSLEECEKLCSTLSILKDQTLEFCGTFESLSKIYGKGFCLMVKCERQNEPSNDVEVLEKFLLRKISHSSIKEKKAESILVHIKVTENIKTSISDLFNLVETNKIKYKIESYSISETTLEEIFLSIADMNENIE
ncbi:ATP-binding cassette sub-family A member 1 [Brachionus plicatilis]|uniref:ATP-binding cassette sub-family A member 1 n=1 Tax=Brachionus plicatilis TaxID=10195 RepID=A0A3M7PSF1_BRAPC|nr:ATP-binding cassette sub-family A member 1 [Brachionus plicatilis]